MCIVWNMASMSNFSWIMVILFNIHGSWVMIINPYLIKCHYLQKRIVDLFRVCLEDVSMCARDLPSAAHSAGRAYIWWQLYACLHLLHQYKKYLHKRPKHILLWSHTLLLQCFFFCAILSLLYLPSPDEVAPWPLAQRVFYTKLVDQDNFCTVQYWSVCIYILQINFYKKKCLSRLPFKIFLMFVVPYILVNIYVLLKSN
jgi:hypothetical protein